MQDQLSAQQWLINNLHLSQRMGKFLLKNEEISGGKAHKNLTEIFLRSQMYLSIRRK